MELPSRRHIEIYIRVETLAGRTASSMQGRRRPATACSLHLLTPAHPTLTPPGTASTRQYQPTTTSERLSGTKNPSRLSTAHALPIEATKSGADHHCREEELRQRPNIDAEIHNQDLTWYDCSAQVCEKFPDAPKNLTPMPSSYLARIMVIWPSPHAIEQQLQWLSAAT